MKKLIAPILLAATVASHATPVTLTATGSHVKYGSSDYEQPHDWSLVLRYDSNQPGNVVIDSMHFSDIFIPPGRLTASAGSGQFLGDVEIKDEEEVEGDFHWQFGTTVDGVPTKSGDLTRDSYIYGYVFRQYTEYLVDSVTISAVPEPGTYGLMLAGLAGIGAFSASRRRQARSSTADC